MTGSFRAQYEETRKRGGIAHRKEKSRWEAAEEKSKPERDKTKKEEGKKEERSWLEDVHQEVPVPSEGDTQQTPVNQDQKMKEEKEKQQERAEEKEIEDQVMEDIRVPEKQGVIESKVQENRASPMHVDGPTQVDGVASTTMEDIEGAPEVAEYTPEEERDMATVVQFFLDGGDQGEEEDVIWQKLAQKVMYLQSPLSIKECNVDDLVLDGTQNSDGMD